MDDNKTPIYAAVIGFCLSFIIYQLIFNRGGSGFLVWVLAFVVPSVIAVAAFFVAKKMA